MGGQTDRYGQMDTDRDRWTPIWTDGHRYGQGDTNKGTDGHRYEQMDTNTDRWTLIWTDGCRYGQMDTNMDRWMQ